MSERHIAAVDLHVFADASIVTSCAVVYTVVHQPSITNQGLVGSKSRISKKNLIIPRLELVSAHMASNLREPKESEKEAKIIRNTLATTVKQKIYLISLEKYELHKVLRVSPWMSREVLY